LARSHSEEIRRIFELALNSYFKKKNPTLIFAYLAGKGKERFLYVRKSIFFVDIYGKKEEEKGIRILWLSGI